ncbi:hypothetical protein [Sphingomonas hengshuiensis]|uniref:hypothetical protein n=1 Tax=Sphingomonas hengshuiensis TaxID=1609977 RepID=UPI0005CB6946|nr:hypothetical protein [Sphingomonas hengshuiensis]
MIRKALIGAALLLLAGCEKAPQDVTARYALAGGAGTITVKAAANGDARVDSQGQTLIRKGGTEYLLIADSQGQYAARIADFVSVMGALAREGGMKPTGLGPQPDYALVKEGTETIAGQTGDVWKVRAPKAPPAETIEAVISGDPALANAGSALAMQTRLGAAGMAQVQGGQGNLEKKIAEMLDKGMVLRFATALTLSSVEKAPISTDIFALPPTVLAVPALKARLVAERARTQAAAAASGAPPSR